MFAVLPASTRPDSVHPGVPLFASLVHAALVLVGVVVTRQVVAVAATPRATDPLPLFVAPRNLTPPPAVAARSAATTSPTTPTVTIPLNLPSTVSLSLPAVDLPRASMRGDVPVGLEPGDRVSRVGVPAVLPGAVLSGTEVDEPVQLVRSSTPTYPPAMRALGRAGVVRFQYVVDTLGIIEPASIRVIESTDPSFTASARLALEQLRFRPARARGRTVRQLAAQVIRFSIEQ